MTDLPAGWEWTTLGDIAESVKNGIYISRPGAMPDGVPILRINAVRPAELRLDEIRYSGKSVENLQSESALLEPGDLLFTRYSGSRDYVGVCAITPNNVGPLTYPDKLIRVRMKEVVPRYVMFAFSSPSVRSTVESSLRTTAGQVGISGTNLKAVRIPLAPLAEQRRIVALLDEQLPHLEVGARSLEGVGGAVSVLWNAVLDGIYRAKFTNKGTPDPSPLVELAEIEGGIQKQPKRRPVVNKYPFLRVANVSRGSLDLNEMYEIELFGGELERYSLRAGDLLVVEGNGSPAQIGRAATWHGEIENCVHQNHLIRVRPGRNLDGRFLELIWNSPATVRQLRQLASSTSGLHTLSTGKLKALKIPAPPLDSQLDLVASAEEWKMRIQRLRESLLQSSMRAKQLRRAVLADAFAGRLVPQDPKDEPASVLLERIKVEQAAQPKAKRARRTPKNPNSEQESLM
ncbi:MAG: restriction endonuclease subunit S [Pseudonocardiaceae bacterium]